MPTYIYVIAGRLGRDSTANTAIRRDRGSILFCYQCPSCLTST